MLDRKDYTVKLTMDLAAQVLLAFCVGLATSVVLSATVLLHQVLV